MWDENSYDTQSFSVGSWLFELVEAFVRRAKLLRALWVLTDSDTLYVRKAPDDIAA